MLGMSKENEFCLALQYQGSYMGSH